MYHLTCPSCHDVTESPFVRNGAVVRCKACENKYRIKSSHFEREVHTGPRTLDETDTVLRSDSVDIDPDEVPPVSIDDDGNVVGLSGLSELMRWGDGNNEEASTDVSSAVNGRSSRKSDTALPAAKTSSSGGKSTAGNGRARAQARKRKKRNKLILMLATTGTVLIVVAVLAIQIIGGNNSDVADDNPGPETPPDNGPKVAIEDPVTPDPDEDPNNPDGQDPDLFRDPNQPEPNPEPQFVAPWRTKDLVDPPIDVPTMLTPARPLVHEGWYVMNPPRGSADAAGVSNVELGQLNAIELSDGITLLSSSITNSSSQVVMQGELHIMLLDGTSNVFAETYVPLAMIEPRSRQPFAMTIPTRYWKRSRGTRASVLVQTWNEPIEPMHDVRLQPAGQGLSAALRVSVKNQGDKALRGAMIFITAIDDADNAMASFLVEEESLYVRKNQWLDLVLATPLHPDTQATKWTATVLPR